MDPSETNRKLDQLSAYNHAVLACVMLGDRVHFWVSFLGTLISLLVWKAYPANLYWVAMGFATIAAGRIIPWVTVQVYSRMLKRAIDERFGT